MPDEPTYAAAPFDHKDGDIILRSSDNVDFRVFKPILSLSSPFFEALFSIPQPAQADEGQETRDGLPVVTVTEKSKTLDVLLRLCYPCTLAKDPCIKELQDALYILNAAQKYSLDAAEKKALRVIMHPKMLEAAPIRCFAIAHQGRLRKETRLAAKYTLAQPLLPEDFQEIELISARDLLSLLTYRRKCGDAVYALRLDLTWIMSHYRAKPLDKAAGVWAAASCVWLLLIGWAYSIGDSVNGHHAGCKCTVQVEPKYKLFDDRSRQNWWERFMDKTFCALRDRPCKATVQAEAAKTVKAVKAGGCPVCSAWVTEGMDDLVELFGRKIEETVSGIELKLNF